MFSIVPSSDIIVDCLKVYIIECKPTIISYLLTSCIPTKWVYGGNPWLRLGRSSYWPFLSLANYKSLSTAASSSREEVRACYDPDNLGFRPTLHIGFFIPFLDVTFRCPRIDKNLQLKSRVLCQPRVYVRQRWMSGSRTEKWRATAPPLLPSPPHDRPGTDRVVAVPTWLHRVDFCGVYHPSSSEEPTDRRSARHPSSLIRRRCIGPTNWTPGSGYRHLTSDTRGPDTNEPHNLRV